MSTSATGRSLPRIQTAIRSQISNVGGLDVAGTVVAVGARVSGLSVGDRAWAMALGAYAEFLRTSAHAAKAPQNITLLEAGSLPLVGDEPAGGAQGAPWTAANHTTVVTSGSGGTGYTAIEIAKALGTTHVAHRHVGGAHRVGQVARRR